MTHLMTEYDEEKLEYIFSFVVNGGFNMVKRWINNENRESPEEMAVLLNDTIKKLVSA